MRTTRPAPAVAAPGPARLHQPAHPTSEGTLMTVPLPPHPLPGLTTYELSAPRGALSYPRCSREEFGRRFLGLMAYSRSER
jgi:hypothetical protein